MSEIKVEIEIGENLAETLQAVVDRIPDEPSMDSYIDLINEIRNLITESIHEVLLKQKVE